MKFIEAVQPLRYMFQEALCCPFRDTAASLFQEIRDVSPGTELHDKVYVPLSCWPFDRLQSTDQDTTKHFG